MHPILIKLGNFELHWYGLLLALGFLVGLWTAARRAKSADIKPEVVWGLGTWLIIGSLLVAKAFHVAIYFDDYRLHFAENPLVMLRSGVVFYGGLTGGIVTTILYADMNKVPLWKLADVLAPSLALGHAFGRVGCFLEGCCYGTRCNLPWAVQYSWAHETHQQPVHPSQLYEAAGLLAIATALHWLFPKRKFDGQVWWLYALFYALLRFKVEFFRGDVPIHWLGGLGLTTAQFLSALLLVVAVVFLVRGKFQKTS